MKKILSVLAKVAILSVFALGFNSCTKKRFKSS